MDKTIVGVLVVLAAGGGYFFGDHQAGNKLKKAEKDSQMCKAQLEMKHETMQELKDKCGPRCWDQ